MSSTLRHFSSLRQAVFAAGLVTTGCFTEATPLPGQKASYDTLQEAYERLLWPSVQATPLPTDGGQAVPTAKYAALQAAMDPAPVDQVSGWLNARCTDVAAGSAPAADELVQFLDAGQPVKDWGLQPALEDAFRRMQSMNAYWLVDMIKFMENPDVGPDATIYEPLPHYATTKSELMDLAEYVGVGAQHESELLTPQVVGDVRQITHDAISVVLDFKKDNAYSEFSAFKFAGYWLGIDWARYQHIYDDGLPRFGWFATLNDMKLDEGEHIWSDWVFDDSPLADEQNEFAQLATDLAAVQTLWRTKVQALAIPAGDHPAMAAAICNARADVDTAIHAEATDSAKAKNNLANRLHDKINATMQLAKRSTNTRLIVPPTATP